MNEYKTYYSHPATAWEESLPVGNGKVGAVVFGRDTEEILRINEETVWSGYERDWFNPQGKDHLGEIREALFREDFTTANALAKQYMSWSDDLQKNEKEIFGVEKSAGDIVLVSHTPCHTLSRSLDMLHGVVETVGDTFKRTHFSPLGQDVFVSRIEGQDLDLDIRYDYHGGDTDIMPEGVEKAPWITMFPIVKDCTAPFDGVEVGGDWFSYEESIPKSITWCMKTVVETDGKREKLPDGLRVREATYVVLYTAIGTTVFHDNARTSVEEKLKKAIAVGYDSLFARHQEAFAREMTKSELTLESNEELRNLPTDERLKAVQNGAVDPGFAELMFNFGKYLLISSSAPDSRLPSNLQGIWTLDNDSPWFADFHVNINLQMNYWGACMQGMDAYELPFFRFLQRLKPSGERVAREMYGCSGWMLHHRTSPWGANVTADDPTLPWGIFVSGGVWCVNHIFEHFRYTQDADFLKEQYSLIKECAQFFFDFLQPYKGYLVTCPAGSPENTFIDPKTGKGVSLCAGPTMDTEIIRDLLEGILEIREVVDERDEAFLDTVRHTLSLLPPLRIGKHGNICEWMEDYEEEEPGHRHISHLYALYPSRQITEDTPVLWEAAKKTIQRRLENGGGHTGWSRSWIMNFYARLKDGEECERQLQYFYTNSLFPNLWDKHPPFQIDGNFGVPAAICGMLYDPKTLELLPALPPSWKNGSFRGFCAHGNKTVSCVWKNGKVVEKEIKER